MHGPLNIKFENVEVIIHPSRLATLQISLCHLSEGQ